jgi:DNA-binding transcriptional LysR family regulator
VQGLVAAGYGVALVPLLSVMPGDPRVKVLDLDPRMPRRRIAVAWHRDRHRSPAARTFIELAQAVGAEVERGLDEP